MNAEDGSEEMGIHTLNMRAYYAATLSLHFSKQHDAQSTMHLEEALAMGHAVWREVGAQFGGDHAFTIGLSLYFGLHLVNIEQLEGAVEHIEYVLSQNGNGAGRRTLSFEERRRVHHLMMMFRAKLSELVKRVAPLEESLRARCVAVMSDERRSAEALNEAIVGERGRRESAWRQRVAEKAERERESVSPRRRIKREKSEEAKRSSKSPKSPKSPKSQKSVNSPKSQKSPKRSKSPKSPAKSPVATTTGSPKPDSLEMKEELDRLLNSEDLRAIDVAELVLEQVPLMIQLGGLKAAQHTLSELEREQPLTERQREVVNSLKRECRSLLAMNENVPSAPQAHSMSPPTSATTDCVPTMVSEQMTNARDATDVTGSTAAADGN